MEGGCSTLLAPVANTWCQNSAIFSTSGTLADDHPVHPCSGPDDLVLAVNVANDYVFVEFGASLRVHEVFDRLFVAPGGIRL